MRFVLRRLGFFVLTLWAALTVNFFIPRLMPGDPLTALQARSRTRLSPVALQQMLTAFGYKPSQNIVSQYFDYLGHMFTGQWGVSIGSNLGEPVGSINAPKTIHQGIEAGLQTELLHSIPSSSHICIPSSSHIYIKGVISGLFFTS